MRNMQEVSRLLEFSVPRLEKLKTRSHLNEGSFVTPNSLAPQFFCAGFGVCSKLTNGC